MFALFNHFCLFQVTISNRRRRSLVSDDEAEVGDRNLLLVGQKKMANKKISSPPCWPYILTSGKFYCKTLQVVNWLHQLKMLRQFFALLPDKVGLSSLQNHMPLVHHFTNMPSKTLLYNPLFIPEICHFC